MTAKRRKTRTFKPTLITDPVAPDAEPGLTLAEIMLSNTEIPSFDDGLPFLVDYSDRDPNTFLVTGYLGEEPLNARPGWRTFHDLDAVEAWAKERYGDRAKLTTKCRVLKPLVAKNLAKLSIWQLEVRRG